MITDIIGNNFGGLLIIVMMWSLAGINNNYQGTTIENNYTCLCCFIDITCSAFGTSRATVSVQTDKSKRPAQTQSEHTQMTSLFKYHACLSNM